MPEINFVHPQINKIKNQDISIQVSLDGFSFSIRASEDNTCLLFRHYKFSNILLFDELIRKTESVISSDNMLHAVFSEAVVTLISQNSAIIPEEFFNPGHLKKYFEFSHNLAEFDELNYSQIQAIGAYNIFSVPGYFSQMFYNLYPNVIFEHQATRLINFGKKNIKANLPPLVIVGLNPGFFDLIIFENEKLVLSNSYQYTNTTDLIYFFLYACRQLKLEIEKLKVLIFGTATQNNLLIDEIASQVDKVIVPDLNIVPLCRNLTSKQAAQFYNLFL